MRVYLAALLGILLIAGVSYFAVQGPHAFSNRITAASVTGDNTGDSATGTDDGVGLRAASIGRGVNDYELPILRRLSNDLQEDYLSLHNELALALRIDPDNPELLQLKTIIDDIHKTLDTVDFQVKSRHEYLDENLELLAAKVDLATEYIEETGTDLSGWDDFSYGTHDLETELSFALGPDTDIDHDGIPNDVDDDIDNDGVPNTYDLDSDNDGKADREDFDTGDDGIPDLFVELIQLDSDGDGEHDVYDTDDDNDGIPDEIDFDSDNDGLPDYIDKDDNNDGVPDQYSTIARLEYELMERQAHIDDLLNRVISGEYIGDILPPSAMPPLRIPPEVQARLAALEASAAGFGQSQQSGDAAALTALSDQLAQALQLLSKLKQAGVDIDEQIAAQQAAIEKALAAAAAAQEQALDPITGLPVLDITPPATPEINIVPPSLYSFTPDQLPDAPPSPGQYALEYDNYAAIAVEYGYPAPPTPDEYAQNYNSYLGGYGSYVSTYSPSQIGGAVVFEIPSPDSIVPIPEGQPSYVHELYQSIPSPPNPTEYAMHYDEYVALYGADVVPTPEDYNQYYDKYAQEYQKYVEELDKNVLNPQYQIQIPSFTLPFGVSSVEEYEQKYTELVGAFGADIPTPEDVAKEYSQQIEEWGKQYASLNEEEAKAYASHIEESSKAEATQMKAYAEHLYNTGSISEEDFKNMLDNADSYAKQQEDQAEQYAKQYEDNVEGYAKYLETGAEAYQESYEAYVEQQYAETGTCCSTDT